MNMVWHDGIIQLYLGKQLAGATSLRVVLSNSLKHMICQWFLTPAGSGFRKAEPDWNILLRVGLDLGSARGLLWLTCYNFSEGELRMPSNCIKPPLPACLYISTGRLVHQQST